MHITCGELGSALNYYVVFSVHGNCRLWYCGKHNCSKFDLQLWVQLADLTIQPAKDGRCTQEAPHSDMHEPKAERQYSLQPVIVLVVWNIKI